MLSYSICACASTRDITRLSTDANIHSIHIYTHNATRAHTFTPTSQFRRSFRLPWFLLRGPTTTTFEKTWKDFLLLCHSSRRNQPSRPEYSHYVFHILCTISMRVCFYLLRVGPSLYIHPVTKSVPLRKYLRNVD